MVGVVTPVEVLRGASARSWRRVRGGPTRSPREEVVRFSAVAFDDASFFLGELARLSRTWSGTAILPRSCRSGLSNEGAPGRWQSELAGDQLAVAYHLFDVFAGGVVAELDGASETRIDCRNAAGVAALDGVDEQRSRQRASGRRALAAAQRSTGSSKVAVASALAFGVDEPQAFGQVVDDGERDMPHGDLRFDPARVNCRVGLRSTRGRSRSDRARAGRWRGPPAGRA